MGVAYLLAYSRFFSTYVTSTCHAYSHLPVLKRPPAYCIIAARAAQERLDLLLDLRGRVSKGRRDMNTITEKEFSK
jgi:hypothetical protein